MIIHPNVREFIYSEIFSLSTYLHRLLSHKLSKCISKNAKKNRFLIGTHFTYIKIYEKIYDFHLVKITHLAYNSRTIMKYK